MFEGYDGISREKAELRVVIFGPYKEGGYKRLVELRKKLREYGYSMTDIVDELSDPPNSSGLEKSVFDTVKSEYWISQCDVAIFVFFKDISHGSVTIELKELVDKHPDRIKCASFFLEDGGLLETLEKGTIRKHKKDIGIFETDEDLYVFAEKACLHHLIEDNCKQTI